MVKKVVKQASAASKQTLENTAFKLWEKSPAAKKFVSERLSFLEEWFFPGNWEDGEFMDDVRQATLRGAHPAANRLFWTIFMFIAIMLIWASFAKIDEVTTGEGKVIPSSNVQTVQNLEGGIIQEIFVREGDIVDKGEVLIRIDDTGFSSSFKEKQAKLGALSVAIPRLAAEVTGEDVVYPEDVAQHFIDSDRALAASRRAEINSTLSVLQSQIEQKQQSYKEAETKLAQAKRAFELKNKEYQMTVPMYKEGVVSQVEMLRVEQELNQLQGEMEAAEISVPAAASGVSESVSRFEEARTKFQTETLKELGEKREEFARLSELIKAVEDQVARTTVRAPVRGTIKQVLVNTIGGVVEPGMDLVELIPLEDTLLVEAKIRPSDIAFLRPNQEARVKFSAYDYSIYGGLDARLERIGVDTVVDERGEAFYQIRVRTAENSLKKGDEDLPIIPGMVATVDILTGKKTVLDYILKPFIKMKENALKEK